MSARWLIGAAVLLGAGPIGACGSGSNAEAGTGGTFTILPPADSDATGETSSAEAQGNDASGSTGDASAPDGDASSLGLDPDTNLLDLTNEQKAKLCDWVNAQLGGYGTVTECPGGNTVKNLDDRAQCIAVGLHYACTTITVREVETCVSAQAPSHGCVTPEAECRALYCT